MADGGYAWWYVDGLSDDGGQGVTLIAFIGSVFSPYYAAARRRGVAAAANHCAMNLSLYGPPAGRWSMTERGSAQMTRDTTQLNIGRSIMRWTGDALHITVDERCAPFPNRVRGSIRVMPLAMNERSFPLGRGGLHHWTPHAPCARIELQFAIPRLAWSGIGYFDANAGCEPLDQGFDEWTWSRAALPDSTVVLYDYQARNAEAESLALRFARDATVEQIDPPPPADLPQTGWRIARRTRADLQGGARVVRTLQDAPFYSRSLLKTHLLGTPADAIHESLDLARFRSRWVQALLPFRMPRITF